LLPFTHEHLLLFLHAFIDFFLPLFKVLHLLDFLLLFFVPFLLFLPLLFFFMLFFDFLRLLWQKPFLPFEPLVHEHFALFLHDFFERFLPLFKVLHLLDLRFLVVFLDLRFFDDFFLEDFLAQLALRITFLTLPFLEPDLYFLYEPLRHEHLVALLHGDLIFFEHLDLAFFIPRYEALSPEIHGKRGSEPEVMSLKPSDDFDSIMLARLLSKSLLPSLTVLLFKDSSAYPEY
jgi:hypothetical protein